MEEGEAQLVVCVNRRAAGQRSFVSPMVQFGLGLQQERLAPIFERPSQSAAAAEARLVTGVVRLRLEKDVDLGLTLQTFDDADEFMFRLETRSGLDRHEVDQADAAASRHEMRFQHVGVFDVAPFDLECRDGP